MVEYDMNSLRIILSLFEAPEENRVVSLGEKLGLKKYDVSKKLSALAEDGFVDKSDVRSIRLTEQGREFAENFSLKLGQVIQRLGYEGMDYDNTLYNAMQIVMHCNEAYFEKFQKPMTEIIRLKQLMSDKPSFSGAELAQRMSPGTYTFPFVIYREKVKHHNNISMANKGFENPCEVISDGSDGRVVLRVKEMEEHSRATGKLLSGRVMKLCYFD